MVSSKTNTKQIKASEYISTFNVIRHLMKQLHFDGDLQHRDLRQNWRIVFHCQIKQISAEYNALTWRTQQKQVI